MISGIPSRRCYRLHHLHVLLVVLGEVDYMAVHDARLFGGEGRLIKARHQPAVLCILDDLQCPRIAAEEATISTLQASTLGPALHEAAQAGHPGVDRRIPIQQLGVVDQK